MIWFGVIDLMDLSGLLLGAVFLCGDKFVCLPFVAYASLVFVGFSFVDLMSLRYYFGFMLVGLGLFCGGFFQFDVFACSVVCGRLVVVVGVYYDCLIDFRGFDVCFCLRLIGLLLPLGF